jgi:hypothetical protein
MTRWHRTQLANPTAPRMVSEDWTLVDGETGEALARINDTEQPDILRSLGLNLSEFAQLAQHSTRSTKTL